MKYTVKPIVCDYAVVNIDTTEIVCICNLKSNAVLIADILNADSDDDGAYSYNYYQQMKGSEE